jgi:hypothetical protein
MPRFPEWRIKLGDTLSNFLSWCREVKKRFAKTRTKKLALAYIQDWMGEHLRLKGGPREFLHAAIEFQKMARMTDEELVNIINSFEYGVSEFVLDYAKGQHVIRSLRESEKMENVAAWRRIENRISYLMKGMYFGFVLRFNAAAGDVLMKTTYFEKFATDIRRDCVEFLRKAVSENIIASIKNQGMLPNSVRPSTGPGATGGHQFVWKELSPVYAEWKEKKGKGGLPKGVLSTRMLGAVSEPERFNVREAPGGYFVDFRGLGGREKLKFKQFHLGRKPRYVPTRKVSRFGERLYREKRGQPPRPFTFITEENMRQIARQFKLFWEDLELTTLSSFYYTLRIGYGPWNLPSPVMRKPRFELRYRRGMPIARYG